MSKDNDTPKVYIFKYFKIFIFMLAGHCTVRFLFQQQPSYEIIFEVIGASLLTAFFWWLYDWTTSKGKD
ncbi:hypothetical protein [Oceanobacillus polygoni]|uniref:Uncharacterized protein n=1 Tax=Oceanobacillus polygoni TaxID=1235259 RepID=A0A9X0YZX0_9BACI|nr:hypothetical protein [Oceanobacillus polygoni]MBP2079409.1 hypothetical protein [Oceanobacillus polygoni]